MILYVFRPSLTTDQACAEEPASQTQEQIYSDVFPNWVFYQVLRCHNMTAGSGCRPGENSLRRNFDGSKIGVLSRFRTIFCSKLSLQISGKILPPGPGLRGRGGRLHDNQLFLCTQYFSQIYKIIFSINGTHFQNESIIKSH